MSNVIFLRSLYLTDGVLLCLWQPQKTGHEIRSADSWTRRTYKETLRTRNIGRLGWNMMANRINIYVLFCVNQNASGIPDTAYRSCGMGTVLQNIYNRLLGPILTGLTGPFPVQSLIVVKQISGVRVERVFQVLLPFKLRTSVTLSKASCLDRLHHESRWLLNCFKRFLFMFVNR